MHTDVVILAAGPGTRLRPLTESIPNCLVPVAGSPILGRILGQLTALGEVHQLRTHVVAGYLADHVIGFVRSQYPGVKVIDNPDYETTNNMFSLSLAFPEVDDDGDLVVVNGDCVYDDTVLSAVLGSDGTVVAVDGSRYEEESMKVRCVDGVLREISKQLQPAPNVLTSIDLYKFDKSHKLRLIDVCRQILERDVKQWTEVAINHLMQHELSYVRACDVTGLRWAEIDNADDLAYANEIFS